MFIAEIVFTNVMCLISFAYFWQDAIVEVPEEYVGAVVDMLGKRRGQMLDMSTSGYVHSK